jgi:hypothetical protein
VHLAHVGGGQLRARIDQLALGEPVAKGGGLGDLVAAVLEVDRVDEAADVVQVAGGRLRVVLRGLQCLDRGCHVTSLALSSVTGKRLTL